jgi:hypothetical protein
MRQTVRQNWIQYTVFRHRFRKSPGSMDRTVRTAGVPAHLSCSLALKRMLSAASSRRMTEIVGAALTAAELSAAALATFKAAVPAAG